MSDIKDMNIKGIAYSQWVDTSLNRYDVFVRCLAVDEYYGRNDYGFKLYDKMQYKRKGMLPGWVDTYKSLIKDLKNNGFDNERPIRTTNSILSDGSHRYSYMLNEGFDKIPVIIDDTLEDVHWHKKWFDRYFNQEEMKQIETKRLQIFDRFGFFSTIMLWNSVEPYFDDIEEEISKSVPILESRTVGYNEDFVREIYKCDDIHPSKVEKKIQYMKGRGDKIRLLKLDVPNPKWRIKFNGNPLSTVGEKIKLKIRGDYQNKIRNYFHDIILHTSDNFQQADFIRNVIDDMYPKS